MSLICYEMKDTLCVLINFWRHVAHHYQGGDCLMVFVNVISSPFCY